MEQSNKEFFGHSPSSEKGIYYKLKIGFLQNRIVYNVHNFCPIVFKAITIMYSLESTEGIEIVSRFSFSNKSFCEVQLPRFWYILKAVNSKNSRYNNDNNNVL